MTTRAGIEVSSRLDAAPEEVWSWVVTADGVNDELRPWLRMTVPGGDFDLNSVETGKPIGRSWVLLFGLIPIDFDEITLVEIDRGRGFVERSRMLSQRDWEHVRTVRPLDGGSLVTDAIAWEPRLPIPAKALRPLFRAIFGHRHRRLRRRFGGGPARGADGSS
jgi:ligand-binding SRPBCC domain-containing protein